MSCDRTTAELVAYHFGLVDDVVRESVEEHLFECRACLRIFLALKRDIEVSATSDVVPSGRARTRLRAAVAKEVERSAAPHGGLSSRRVTVLSFGFAAAAVACAFAITAQIATSDGVKPRGADHIIELRHP